MKKKHVIYIALPLAIIVSLILGYKYYCVDIITEYIQITHYPRMVKLYTLDLRTGKEYNAPEIKMAIKNYENDSIAFSSEYSEAEDRFNSIKEYAEEDFLNYMNDRRASNSPYYGKALFYHKESQKEIYLIKFEHTRTYNKEAFLADIKEIGIDSYKLTEYMEKNHIRFNFTPIWIPDLDNSFSLTNGGRRKQL